MEHKSNTANLIERATNILLDPYIYEKITPYYEEPYIPFGEDEKEEEEEE
jgi:hypothetical protein